MNMGRRMLSLIVAMTSDRVIGDGAGMLWHIPADLKHFKKITLGKTVIMGYNTFKAIGKPLQGRKNLVFSRAHLALAEDEYHCVSNVFFTDSNVFFTNSEWINEIVLSAESKEAIVIGGGQIYELFLPFVNKIYLTEIHGLKVKGSVYFPTLENWETQEFVRRPKDSDTDYDLTFSILKRR